MAKDAPRTSYSIVDHNILIDLLTYSSLSSLTKQSTLLSFWDRTTCSIPSGIVCTCNTLFNDKFSLGVVRTKHAINLAKSGRIILPQKVATSFPARYYRVLSKPDVISILQLLSYFVVLPHRSLDLQC